MKVSSQGEVKRASGSSVELAKSQRSHLLFVLSRAKAAQTLEFETWYKGDCRDAILNLRSVLKVQHYEQHKVDISSGRYPRLPFQYLGIYELSLDGAEESAGIIEQISELYRLQPAAELPATWLYYPFSERIGRPPSSAPCMLTLAFANGVGGADEEFQEWYATRHIRHAMHIPALISGQCFKRTQFQSSGASEAAFSVIAVYEQEGTPEAILNSFETIPAETFHFPALDLSRFAEWVYQPI